MVFNSIIPWIAALHSSFHIRELIQHNSREETRARHCPRTEPISGWGLEVEKGRCLACDIFCPLHFKKWLLYYCRVAIFPQSIVSIFVLCFQAEGQNRRQRQQVHADDERARRQVPVRHAELGTAGLGAVGAPEGRGRYPGRCSTDPSLISICVSVLQFAATDEHSVKYTNLSQFEFQSSILRSSKWVSNGEWQLSAFETQFSF